MKPIQPVNVWSNGQTVEANNINLSIVNDNLSTSATFYYQLVKIDVENNVVSFPTQGNLTISGEDYENWGDSGDINLEAYQWAATQLNLTLV